MKRNSNRGSDRVTLVREVIASGTVTRLDRCGCGDLYLTVGPITMALHPEALADLSATVSQAIATLGCEAATSQAAGEGGSGPAVDPPSAEGSAPEAARHDEELN
jgi:hypothetical protein